MNKLNVGCGNRIHPEWANVDFVAVNAAVKAHDLRKGIPYPHDYFDCVYHSHVLEHLPKKSAEYFMRECFRVMKRGGILRVVVPDLEKIARGYLEALEKASSGSPGWDENYEWMLLELYDQTVRERSYGGLVDYFRRVPIPNWDFIYQRWGVQAKILLKHFSEQAAQEIPAATSRRNAWGYVFRSPGRVLKHKLVRALLGEEDWEALQVGKFRREGEVHFWMYDAYSLSKLLRNTEFHQIRQCDANDSFIPAWTRFNLDTEPDGTVYKPDSLYMEAQKL